MKRKIVAMLAVLTLTAAGQALAGASAHHHDADPIAAIAGLRDQLNLNTSQQMQFDNALAQSKAAHQAMRDGFAQLQAAAQTELAKSSPDLRALAALSDQVRDQASGPRKDARAAWLALYDTLSPDQKLVVRDAINARIAQAQALRAEMRAARGR